MRTVFRHAHVIDAEGPDRPDATVVVDGERIARVVLGAAGDAQLGDREIDLKGRTLAPGLVSAHFHSAFRDLGSRPAARLGLEDPAPYLALAAAQNLSTALDCGVTSVVSASVVAAIDPSLKRAILDGTIRGPRLLAGSNELASTGDMNLDRMYGYLDLGNPGMLRVCDGVDGVRGAVRDEIKRGADIVKFNASHGHVAGPTDEGFASFTQAEFDAGARAAHERGARVRAHAVTKTAILACARAGFDVIDHADRIDEECIDAILEAGSFVTPTLFYPSRLLAMLDNAPGDTPTPPQRGGARFDRKASTRSLRSDFERMCEWLPRLVEAGVPLLLGDDFGLVGFPHGIYGEEFAFYTKTLGIDAREVLRWGSVNGAKLMGLGDELGIIEEGRRADLIVVDGNPLTDPDCLRDRAKVRAVVKNGVFVKDEL